RTLFTHPPDASVKSPSGQVTVKLVALVAVPAGVVTVMWPVVAAGGTFATILIAVSETIVAVVPLNATCVAPARLWPLIVTSVSAGPDLGVKPAIAGVTRVVIRLIELLSPFVNQIAPSGPAVSRYGKSMPLPV